DLPAPVQATRGSAVRLLLVLALCGVAHAEPRGAYVAELIDAIRTTDKPTLANTHKYIQTVERNKCQAPATTLRVGCLLEAAAQYCKSAGPSEQAGRPHPLAGERCRRVADVIATNLLAERVFVPNDVRFELVGKAKDARVAIARELYRRYA